MNVDCCWPDWDKRDKTFFNYNRQWHKKVRVPFDGRFKPRNEIAPTNLNHLDNSIKQSASNRASLKLFVFLRCRLW